MQKSTYEYYAYCQKRITNLSLVKTVLINLGLVFGAITLIIYGITLITVNQDNAIKLALPIFFILTITCFLSIVPVNNKMRELRAKKRNGVRPELANY